MVIFAVPSVLADVEATRSHEVLSYGASGGAIAFQQLALRNDTYTVEIRAKVGEPVSSTPYGNAFGMLNRYKGAVPQWLLGFGTANLNDSTITDVRFKPSAWGLGVGNSVADVSYGDYHTVRLAVENRYWEGTAGFNLWVDGVSVYSNVVPIVVTSGADIWAGDSADGLNPIDIDYIRVVDDQLVDISKAILPRGALSLQGCVDSLTDSAEELGLTVKDCEVQGTNAYVAPGQIRAQQGLDNNKNAVKVVVP
jgi:hypothetical protein